MTPAFQKLAGVVAIAWLGIASAVSPAGQGTTRVPDFTVFVDPPTGFVFVKLPAGWKFVGQADLQQVTARSAGVVTSLLEGRDVDAPEPHTLAATAR